MSTPSVAALYASTVARFHPYHLGGLALSHPDFLKEFALYCGVKETRACLKSQLLATRKSISSPRLTHQPGDVGPTQGTPLRRSVKHRRRRRRSQHGTIHCGSRREIRDRHHQSPRLLRRRCARRHRLRGRRRGGQRCTTKWSQDARHQSRLLCVSRLPQGARFLQLRAGHGEIEGRRQGTRQSCIRSGARQGRLRSSSRAMPPPMLQRRRERSSIMSATRSRIGTTRASTPR